MASTPDSDSEATQPSKPRARRALAKKSAAKLRSKAGKKKSAAATAGIVAGAAAAVAVGIAATVGRKRVVNAATAVAKKVRRKGKAGESA